MTIRLLPSTAWLSFIALACGTPQPIEDSPCPVICAELVDVCGIAAFPSKDSCIQGCEYDASEGADVDSQWTCLQDAACDPFEIIECDHAYGIEE